MQKLHTEHKHNSRSGSKEMSSWNIIEDAVGEMVQARHTELYGRQVLAGFGDRPVEVPRTDTTGDTKVD